MTKNVTKSKVRLLGQAEIWRCSKGCQTKNNGENGEELAIYRAEWPEVEYNWTKEWSLKVNLADKEMKLKVQSSILQKYAYSSELVWNYYIECKIFSLSYILKA